MRGPLSTVSVSFFRHLTFSFLDVGCRRNGTSCIWLTSEEAVNELYFGGTSCASAGSGRTERMHICGELF